jgi:hypothetical protein
MCAAAGRIALDPRPGVCTVTALMALHSPPAVVCACVVIAEARASWLSSRAHVTYVRSHTILRARSHVLTVLGPIKGLEEGVLRIWHVHRTAPGRWI